MTDGLESGHFKIIGRQQTKKKNTPEKFFTGVFSRF